MPPRQGQNKALVKNLLQPSRITAHVSAFTNTRLTVAFGKRFLRLVQMWYLPATHCGGSVDRGFCQIKKRTEPFYCKWQNNPVQLIHPRWCISKKVKVLIMKAPSLCLGAKQPLHSSLSTLLVWSIQEEKNSKRKAWFCDLGYLIIVPVQHCPYSQSGKGVSIY